MKKTILLTSEQRRELEQFSRTGIRSVRLVKRAKIILELDSSEDRKVMTQGEIAKVVGVSRKTVNDVKSAFLAAESTEAFLQRKKRETPPRTPKITGDIEARIITIACGEVPNGCARWTIQLIADKCIELNIVDSISLMTVHRVLKKRNLSLT
jgi:predicted XRE-type DNA-binding protein